MVRTNDQLRSDLTSEFVTAVTENLSDSFRDQYLGKVLLSKYADPDPASALERAEAAVSKWLQIETSNKRTNLRLYLSDEEEKVIGGFTLQRVLNVARTIIRKVIGSSVPMTTLMGGFSGGASTSQGRRPGVTARKYTERPHVTQDAWDLIWPWIYQDHDLWLKTNPLVLDPEFVRGNVMFTVPKNNTIDRVACKEPDLNMYLQRATGDFLRDRLLRRAKINLNDQTINQGLARMGSIDGVLATVDMSSASDTVTTQLACAVLPTDWFVFLEKLRCRETLLPSGEWHENEMLSSMGNGFTFELESLLFWALAKALDKVTRTFGIVSVYGDDLILSGSLFGLLKHFFNFLGFKVNSEKSFHKGDFRESCGKHYLKGVDVTPFYLRRPVNTIPELIRVLNRLRSWCASGTWCDANWWEVWRQFSYAVPRKLHGGWDLESIETLVSKEGPGYRLMRKTVNLRKSSAAFDLGLYLEWQDKARKRHGTTDASASIVIQAGYRVGKPLQSLGYVFGTCRPEFPQEYIAIGEDTNT